MEEIARQDGSLQLGGMSPEAETMLELTRISALFQKFPAAQPSVAPPVVVTDTVVEAEQAPSTAVIQPVAA